MNNCELSDWESITISTDSNNPTTMDYDGFITNLLLSTSGQQSCSCTVNNIRVYSALGWQGGELGAPIPVKKGDTVYLSLYRITSVQSYGSFYKKRDYTNR